MASHNLTLLMHRTTFGLLPAMQELLKKHNARAAELRAFTKGAATTQKPNDADIMIVNPVHNFGHSRNAQHS